MLRKFISLILLGAYFIVSAQDLKGLHFGVSISPFQYWYNNKYISRKDDLKSDNNFINGIQNNIFIEYYLNNKLGFKTGLGYSSQKQILLNKLSSGIFVSNSIITHKLNYFNLPILIDYSFPINEKLIFTSEQGVQILFLNSFEYVWQGADENNNITSIQTTTNNSIKYVSITNPENNFERNENYKLYKKSLIGYLGKVGTKYLITDRLFINSNLIFNYDFGNTDDNGNNTYLNGKQTHNIRAGIELGISYKLEKRCNCSE